MDTTIIESDSQSATGRVPGRQRRFFIGLAFVLFYPLGLFLLLKSPRTRAWERVVAPVVFLPFLALLVLLALKPYWDFSGRLSRFSDLSFDFNRFRDPDVLEAHRATQRQSAPAQPALSFDASLSWTDFRGPRRDGVCDDQPITTDWTAAPPREVWRQPVGAGYAAFVIGSGRAFTIEQRRKKEAVVCYDAATGRELWAHDYDASFEETLGGDGPRATPTLRGDRIYSLGAAGHLCCLDAATGRASWSHEILDDFDADNLAWGMSGAPLVFDDKVVVTNSGKPNPSVLAYAAADGKLLWTCDAGVQGYSSPMLVELAGRKQILNLAAAALNAIDPETGALLWSHPWTTDMGINCSQPVLAGDDRVFVSSGYGYGSALLKIERDGDKFKVSQLWKNMGMKNKFTSSVIYNGAIYGLDEAILCCLDLETGKRNWKGGRYNYGSLLRVGAHLLVLAEDGALVLVKADPSAWQEVGRIEILNGKTWNNFALVGGRLFARNHKEMVCYDLRPTPPTSRAAAQ